MEKPWNHGGLCISDNGHSIEHRDGTPFFWLGDTAWLLFSRLTREEAAEYLDRRMKQGFNVVQIMMVHRLLTGNIYGSSFAGFEETDWNRGPGMSDGDGYWAVIDTMVRMAEDRGLYAALVPVWGSLVEHGLLDEATARRYGAWLGSHFRDRPNIIWLNGGDTRGNEHAAVWHALGNAIKANDPDHLMTFHPYGRSRSSRWFHRAGWLDFNMFQSGHRRYGQGARSGGAMETDRSAYECEETFEEDNWRYVIADLELNPVKPTIDGEPSYEGIPQGLHDPEEPFWEACDARRYAYWSVFAGAAGHTYGHSAIMQMHKPQFAPGAYSVRETWDQALDAPGALQMRHLRTLFESVDHATGHFSPEIIVGDARERYDRLMARTGPGYVMVYAYTPRAFSVDVTRAMPGADLVTASWFHPVDGRYESIGTWPAGMRRFEPPVASEPGNDIVLVLRERR